MEKVFTSILTEPNFRELYQEGVREGKGIFRWPDGRSLEGNYQQGQVSGKMVLNFSGGS